MSQMWGRPDPFATMTGPNDTSREPAGSRPDLIDADTLVGVDSNEHSVALTILDRDTLRTKSTSSLSPADWRPQVNGTTPSIALTVMFT